ncbi:hypothetical protein J6590_028554 [Homalodisca vitripennis]|nr:hypothetical protein J6590_028554 [Homalodisca vitripennis]
MRVERGTCSIIEIDVAEIEKKVQGRTTLYHVLFVTIYTCFAVRVERGTCSIIEIDVAEIEKKVQGTCSIIEIDVAEIEKKVQGRTTLYHVLFVTIYTCFAVRVERGTCSIIEIDVAEIEKKVQVILWRTLALMRLHSLQHHRPHSGVYSCSICTVKGPSAKMKFTKLCVVKRPRNVVKLIIVASDLTGTSGLWTTSGDIQAALASPDYSLQGRICVRRRTFNDIDSMQFYMTKRGESSEERRSPSSKVASDLLSLNRSMSSKVIGLITGHGHLRKHLHRVGILQEDPLCGRCNEQEETAEHLLFDCPAIARERYAIFGSLDRGGEFSQEDLIGCFRRFVELLKL